MTTVKHVGLRALAVVLLALGAWLTGGGAWLTSLGGSWYYLLAGLATLASGTLVWRRRRLGLWIYLALFAATVVWALCEVGLDFWQLVPRIGLPLAIALYLLTPWVRGAFSEAQGASFAIATAGRGRLAGFTLAGFAVVAALAFAWYKGRDVIAARPDAKLPPPQTMHQGAGWSNYGASETGTRYSVATEVTPDNVHRLGVAWQYHTGDLPSRYPNSKSAFLFEATPILASDTLYFCTPHDIVIALDADTGKERWRYDPKVNDTGIRTLVCRGVAYHEAHAPVAECPRRILVATIDARLIALDATTGEPCRSFGQHGEVSLLEGLGDVAPGIYSVTSPALIVGDAAIVGSSVLDDMATDTASGVVRAYDAVTGRQLWAWDAARPAELGPLKPGETYPRGSPNAWSLFSADPALGLVFIPTGNAAGDYFGGQRSEAFDHFSSSVVALEAATGRLRWSFQTVHHDLWDYDVGSQPVLVDLPINGETVPALIQPTKQGEVFVLDRRNGHPLTAIEERAVPQGEVPGERYSKTQPDSVGMPSFAPPLLTESDMWGTTQLDQLLCRIEFRKRRYQGRFTPPSVAPTIEYPGNFGVMDWGSVAVDEARRVMVVNASFMPFLARLVPREEAQAMQAAGSGHRFLAVMPQLGTPFAVEFGPFLSPMGLPCNAPPWGKIAAVDLDTRRIVWEKPFGTSRDQAPFDISVPGAFSLGGAAITKGGVIFIAAATDNYLRAFELASGRELWKGRLPAGGQASAMTYVSQRTGRQYVVVAAGGHPYLRTTPGDSVVAFALPD